jgi:signal peptidase II
VRNNGGAFGVLQNGKFVFIFFAILAIFYFVYIIFSEEHLNNLFIMSSSLIVGGGMSNLLDRIFRGYVVDYIQLSFFPPAFNLSDFCICAGCILLSVHTLFSGSLPKDG